MTGPLSDHGEVQVGGELDEARLAAIMVRGLRLRNMCADPKTVLAEYAEPVPGYVAAPWSQFQGVAQHSDGETPTVCMDEGDDGETRMPSAEIHVGCGEVCPVLATIPWDGDSGGVDTVAAEAIVHAGRDLIDLVREVVRLRAELDRSVAKTEVQALALQLERARKGATLGERMGSGAAVSSHVVGPFLAGLDPATRMVLEGIVSGTMAADDVVFTLLNQPEKAAAVVAQLPAGYLADLVRQRPDFQALAVWASLAASPTPRLTGAGLQLETPWQNEVGVPYVDIVFTGPPSGPCQFVEVENCVRQGIRLGDWVDRGDGFWALRIAGRAVDPQPPIELVTLTPSAKELEFEALRGGTTLRVTPPSLYKAMPEPAPVVAGFLDDTTLEKRDAIPRAHRCVRTGCLDSGPCDACEWPDVLGSLP